MPRSLHVRLSRLEQRHRPMRGGVIEVPCAPGQDIEEAARALGLLDDLTGPVALVPTTSASAEEWEASVTAELVWIAQHHSGSAETEPLQIDAAHGG